MLKGETNVAFFNKQDTLKQKYIYEQMPQKADFQSERTLVLETIVDQILKADPNTLLICGADYIFYIQRFKIIYGLRAEELRVLINLFINLLFGNIDLTIQIRSYIVKILTYLCELAIQIEDLNIDMMKILEHYQFLCKNNHRYNYKQFETYVNDLSSLITLISKHGDDIMDKVFEMAVNKRELRYIAIFIGCLKKEENAKMLIKELFEVNGFWEQDHNWFFIISVIMKKFPTLEYTRRFSTIFLNAISVVSETLNASENDETRLFGEESIGVPPMVRSIPEVMVNLIVPSTKAHCEQVWMYIQRIMNMILSPISITNQPIGCIVMVDFIKNFVKLFVKRHSREHKMWHYAFNEDAATNFAQFIPIANNNPENFMDDYCYEQFDKIVTIVINKFLFVQNNTGSTELLINILVTFKPQYHTAVLNRILEIFHKDEQVIINSAIFCVTHLLEYSIVVHPQKIEIMIDIARRLLQIIDRLGLNDNMHILEVILRMFIYFPKDSPPIDSLKQEILDLLIQNLDTMSIVLSGISADQQSELFIDLGNFFNPLFFSLDKNQFEKFRQRFLYHVLDGVKEHSQCYEKIIMIYSYMDPTFSDKICPKIFDHILKQSPTQAEYFFEATKLSLQIQNKQSLKWYSSILQCSLQYQPQMIIKYWQKLDQLISCMLRHSNKQIFQCGYSMTFNLVICLLQKSLSYEEFNKPQNYKYQTMNINWKPVSRQALELINKIVEKYVTKIISFVRNRFKNKIGHKYSYSELIDGILVQLSENQHASEERKLLQKIISIIESVVTALLPQLKVKQDEEGNKWQALLGTDLLVTLPTLRDDVISFLEDVIHVANTFGFLSDPDFIRVFYHFYSDMHGNVYISDMLNPAENILDKLKAWSVTRSLNVQTSQYILIGQVLFNYYLRLDFLTAILPFRRLYPNAPWIMMVLDHQQALKVQDRIVDPYNAKIFHQKHKQILKIWLSKLSITNPNSYVSQALNKDLNQNKKQRYQRAITEIVSMFKKITDYLNLVCCAQDNQIRQLIFQISKTYTHIQKKKDKTLMLDNLFNVFAVQFQPSLSLRKHRESLIQILRNQNRISFAESTLLNNIISKYHTLEYKPNNQNIAESNQLTVMSMKKIVKQCIQILKIPENQKQRYLALIGLFMLFYSQLIDNNDELLSDVFNALEKLASNQTPDIAQMGRMGLFHLINRVQRQNLNIYKVQNVPKKTSFDVFLMERSFNVPNGKQAGTAFCHKYKYMYYNYPWIEGSQQISLNSKKQLTPLEITINSFLLDQKRLTAWFQTCLSDKQFIKSDEPVSIKIISNAQGIINYLLDKDPLKMNIFAEFSESYEQYAPYFYYRFVKKMAQLGGQSGVKILEQVAENFRTKTQYQYQNMYAQLGTGILKRSKNQVFIFNYIQTLTTCNNQTFITHLLSLQQVFKQNPYTVKNIYSQIVKRLRQQKGASRFRHFDIWKIFVLNQGRWSQDECILEFKQLSKGITQSSPEIADAVVGAIVQCFTVPINLQQISKKVHQPLTDLVSSKKVFKVNQRVGFPINLFLQELVTIIDKKIEEEKNLQSQGLRVYTNIATKMYQNLLVYQFNDYFYDILSGMINYLIQKSIDDTSEMETLKRLATCEYPYHIYKKLKIILEDLSNRSPLIVRKKLKLLQVLIFNRNYSTNSVQIPNICEDLNNLTIYHITALSNILKSFTAKQLQQNVTKALAIPTQSKYPLLMSLLMASGNSLYQWKQQVLKTIVGWKNKKLVKQFASTWWKGKGQGNEGEQSLAILVKNVGNAYNYLA